MPSTEQVVVTAGCALVTGLMMRFLASRPVLVSRDSPQVTLRLLNPFSNGWKAGQSEETVQILRAYRRRGFHAFAALGVFVLGLLIYNAIDHEGKVQRHREFLKEHDSRLVLPHGAPGASGVHRGEPKSP